MFKSNKKDFPDYKFTPFIITFISRYPTFKVIKISIIRYVFSNSFKTFRLCFRKKGIIN